MKGEFTMLKINNINFELCKFEYVLIENGWKRKRHFLHKRFLPLCINLKNKFLSSKDGGSIPCIEISILHNKPKNYFYHLESFIEDLMIWKYIPVFGYWGELGYFLQEYIPEAKIYIYRCYVKIGCGDVDITKPAYEDDNG